MEANRNLVVVVDDDVSYREALEELISSFGLCATSFASAREFLNSEVSETAACLVVDVQMPGMDGLELQSALNEQHRTIPTIFVTSFADAATRTRAMAAGALSVLDKPVDHDVLIRQINGVLEHAG